MMRQALKSSGTIKARPVRIPAPIGGWNTADSLAIMKPTDAVYLDNFFPRTSDVIVRKGNQQKALIPAGKSIRSLIGYKASNGDSRLFAAADDGFYDVTDGDATAPVIACSNGEWESTAITTQGGSFLLACNGVDLMKFYNSSSWVDISNLTTPGITGVPTDTVTNLAKFKSRVIMCVKDSLSFWYLPLNSFAGAATEFPLGGLFSQGGYLMATTTWTVDGGNGPDDYFVAITSEGEVAVYRGSDPSDTSFGLVGIFKLARPMSRRCFVKLASDTAVLTQSAIYPLAKSLGIVEIDKRVALTAKIQRAYADFANLYKDLYGWSITLFSEESMLLVNVPVLNYTTRNIIYTYQFVMNTMTGSWCRFLNMSAECMLAFDGKLYSALHNKVTQAWTGNLDGNGGIVASAKLASSPLGTGANKHVTMVKPVISAAGALTLQLGLDVNYEQRPFDNGTVTYEQDLSLWDSAVWNVSKWNGSGQTISTWRSVACKMGSMVSLRLRCTTKGVSMTWIEVGMLVEDGGLI